jgi:hypothetical protein
MRRFRLFNNFGESLHALGSYTNAFADTERSPETALLVDEFYAARQFGNELVWNGGNFVAKLYPA